MIAMGSRPTSQNLFVLSSSSWLWQRFLGEVAWSDAFWWIPRSLPRYAYAYACACASLKVGSRGSVALATLN